VVDADGAPRFPNARYHVHPADWAHFAGDPVIRRWDGQRYDARAALRAMARSGAVSLVADDHEVSPGVHAVHAPGHTPGHRCVVVEDRDETLLLAGDLLHSPIQVARPDWPSAHDVDADVGCRSRAGLLERAASGRWSVAISHFARPFGTVEADDRGKRWRSVP
jgi:glyoxylase-like metal-dependent hydrolase (beta-lactamase superfamily II)